MQCEQSEIEEVQSWVEEHGDLLFHYAISRVKNETLVEDLVQNTFIAALKGIKRFNRESKASTWLIGILKNQIIDHYRKEKRWTSIEDYPVLEKAFHDDYNSRGSWLNPSRNWKITPQSFSENRELQETLWTCIDKLPERVRQLYINREIEGDSTDEICVDLNISPSNLGVLIHRARHSLRKCFSENGLKTLEN